MRGASRLVLAGLGSLACLTACAFPDVDYADGGGASTGASGASGAGGACAGLAACTASAASCAGDARDQHTTCTAACKNGSPGCTMKCDQTESDALLTCSMTCTKVCAPDCASNAPACAAAVGP